MGVPPTSWYHVIHVLAILVVLIAILRFLGTLIITRRSRRLRSKAERILEIVEKAEELSDVVFRGEGTAEELDRELSELLKIPDISVALRFGIAMMNVWETKGREDALDEVLRLIDSESLEAFEPYLIPFDVRLRTTHVRMSAWNRVRGLIVPLGWSVQRSKRRDVPPHRSERPVIVLLGVCRSGSDDIDPDVRRRHVFVFGGIIGSERVFSVLSTLLVLNPGDLRKLTLARRRRSRVGIGAGAGMEFELDLDAVENIIETVCETIGGESDGGTDDVWDAVGEVVESVAESAWDGDGNGDGDGDGDDGDDGDDDGNGGNGDE
ncbi:hypothetical protein [Methanopyrus kandleri]